MTLHLRATGCHLPYEIIQCYLPPYTSERTALTPDTCHYLPTQGDGRLS